MMTAMKNYQGSLVKWAGSDQPSTGTSEKLTFFRINLQKQYFFEKSLIDFWFFILIVH